MRILLVIACLGLACAPPSRKSQPTDLPGPTIETDSEKPFSCTLQGPGICGDVYWVTAVTNRDAGVLEIRWHSIPPAHQIVTRLTMDCCGSPAPCTLTTTVIDGTHERVSGIRVTGGEWTLLLSVVATDGTELARTKVHIGL